EAVPIQVGEVGAAEASLGQSRERRAVRERGEQRGALFEQRAARHARCEALEVALELAHAERVDEVDGAVRVVRIVEQRAQLGEPAAPAGRLRREGLRDLETHCLLLLRAREIGVTAGTQSISPNRFGSGSSPSAPSATGWSRISAALRMRSRSEPEAAS